MKKLLTLFLGVLCLLCLTFGLYACSGGNPPHDVHVQVSTGYNDTHHYSVCSCGEKFDFVAHQKASSSSNDYEHYNVCTCGAQFNKQDHIKNSTNFDGTHHYSICTCGKQFDKKPHRITNSKEYCIDCNTTVVYDAESFQLAIELTQYYDMHISLANDITFEDFEWLPPAIKITNTRTCTIDGRGFALIGLNSSIYEYTYGMTFTVKNLTFRSATVTEHFIGDVSANPTSVASLFSSEMLRAGKCSNYTFDNVHVDDCSVSGSNYVGAFVSYSNGGNILVTNCSFKGTLTAGGSVGVVVGHTIANVTVNGLEIKADSQIKCTADRGTSERKAGSVIGTVAHSHDVFSGVQTIIVKNVTNNGEVVNINGIANPHNTDIYGRIVQPDNSKGACVDCVIVYNP